MAVSASARRSGTTSMSMGADIDGCDAPGIVWVVALAMTVSPSWVVVPAPNVDAEAILSANRGGAGCSRMLELEGSLRLTTWCQVCFAEALFWALRAVGLWMRPVSNRQA